MLTKTIGSAMKSSARFVFVAIVVGGTVLLLDYYRRNVPLRYFLYFLILIGLLVFVQIGFHFLAKRKFNEKHHIAKIMDLFLWILLSLLFYLFAVYVYPG
jgi:hypothetical protein